MRKEEIIKYIDEYDGKAFAVCRAADPALTGHGSTLLITSGIVTLSSGFWNRMVRASFLA
jgi:hypothetical protein